MIGEYRKYILMDHYCGPTIRVPISPVINWFDYSEVPVTMPTNYEEYSFWRRYDAFEIEEGIRTVAYFYRQVGK